MSAKSSTKSFAHVTGWRAGVQGAWEFVREEWLLVTVPQKLFIQNVRLGMFQRVLQALCLGFVFGFMMVEEAWRARYKPAFFDTRFAIPSNSAGVDEEPLCQDIEQYQSGNDPHRLKCGSLRAAASQHQQSEQTIFIPTYVQERVEKLVMGGLECGQSVQHHCSGKHWRRRSEVFNVSAGASEMATLCSCLERKEIPLVNSEQQQIVFFHGYEIELRNFRSWTEAENIEAGGWKTAIYGDGRSMHRALEKTRGIMTVVMGRDGKPCHLSRKERWLPEESQQGIYGTLSEWLACAGVSLDDDPSLFLPNTAGHMRASHQVRTFSMALHLRVRYDNMHKGAHDGVVCLVNVEILPRVTPPAKLAHVRSDATGHAVLVTTESWHYGVQFTTSVSGSIRGFSVNHLVQLIVSLAVIFTFPQKLTILLALYGLGLVSEIYRRARRTRLSIRNAFQHAITKILLAENAFRGLTGTMWEGHACTQMRKRDVVDHLQEVFCPDRDDIAQIDEKVLECLAQMLVHRVDQTDDGIERMTCRDFVQYCTEQDIFDVNCIVRFLAREKKDSLLKRFFDNSAYEHDQAKATVMGRRMSTDSECDRSVSMHSVPTSICDVTAADGVMTSSTTTSSKAGGRLMKRIQAIEANLRALQEMAPPAPSRGALVQQVQFEVDLHLDKRVPELIKKMTSGSLEIIERISKSSKCDIDSGSLRATLSSWADTCVPSSFSGDGGTEAECHKQSITSSADLGMPVTATEAEKADSKSCDRRPSLPPTTVQRYSGWKCNSSNQPSCERSRDEGNKDDSGECREHVEGEAGHHPHHTGMGMATATILTRLGQRLAKMEGEIAAFCTQQKVEEAVERLAAQLRNESCDALDVQRRLEALESSISTCKVLCCCSNKSKDTQPTETEAAVHSKTPHVLPAVCSGNAESGSGPLPLQDCSSGLEQKGIKAAASSTIPSPVAEVPANTYLLQVPNTLTPASDHWMQPRASRTAQMPSLRAAKPGFPGTGFRNYLEPAFTDASALWSGSSTARSSHAEDAIPARNQEPQLQLQPSSRRLPGGVPREQRL